MVLRLSAAACLCFAAAACNNDDIVSESTPQEGIIPTQIIFNATRGNYDGDTQTRAPKSEWEEGDVVLFCRLASLSEDVEENELNKATYTGGKWVIDINYPIPNYATLAAIYGEHMTFDDEYYYPLEGNGDVAYTNSGSYKVDKDGIASISLCLDKHPQGRMTFTGVGQGKELVVLNMSQPYQWYYKNNPEDIYLTSAGPITIIGEEDGTATLYALPDPSILSKDGITLTVKYGGVWYTKTFAGKTFKKNSNIILAVPSIEGGWKYATTEYEASDLKLGDYFYSDGSWSDGGLRKLVPDGTFEVAPGVAPVAGKTVIGIVFQAGRHSSDASDYTKALNAGGPVLSGDVRGYAVSLTGVGDQPRWLMGPDGIYRAGVKTSKDKYDWNGYANCQAIHDYVEANAGEGWLMRHFQAAWSSESYGNRSLDYDGLPTSNYEWQAPLKAPAGTSGWFLPSYGQLKHIMSYNDIMEEKFMIVKENSSDNLVKENIEGFGIFYYYSSTMNDDLFVWGRSVGHSNLSRLDGQSMARPIIVF